MPAADLTFDLLHELFRYDPDTGELHWKIKRSNRARLDKRAGSQNANGYWQVSFGGGVYYQHRIAWKMMHGEWPDNIDHINRDKSDNRLNNLRSVTHSENLKNADWSETNRRNAMRRWHPEV